MSRRTIYRYIDTFRAAGFVIKKHGEYIRIEESSPHFKDISQLVHFTTEEAYILKSAIESIDENNLLKQNLKKKLYTVYDYKILAETVVKGKNAVNVNRLVEAIEEKKQVVFDIYYSAHSQDARSRRVEPFAFTTNYVQIWCYDLEDNSNKLFKVSRINEVVLTDKTWEATDKHQQGDIDIFRIHSDKKFPVSLKLGSRSTSLLIEEYPLSYEHLKRISEKVWLLKTEVCSYEGIGRFVMGLYDDIEIIDSPEFSAYIKDRIDKLSK
jgi:predicted DNA-binding transcriptional regulator YafY